MVNEEDLVLCTVDKIEGTTVFVHLPENQRGTIITSEIAPGRIKNMREYVVPNKKIVCKVLRIIGDNIELSLRRVSVKERADVMEIYKQEQTSKSALHSVLKENAPEVEQKIMNNFRSLAEFFVKSRETPDLVEKYIPKAYREAISKIIQKKQKEIEVSKVVNLKCIEPDGVKKIKSIFGVKNDRVRVSYLAAGRFQLVLKAPNYKDANHQIMTVVEKLQQSAKANKCEFSVTEK